MIAAFFLALFIGAISWLAGPHMPFIFAVVIPLACFCIFLAGVVRKILLWGSSPSPYPIALTAGQQQSLKWIAPAKVHAPSGKFMTAVRVMVDTLFFLPLLRNTSARAMEGRPIYWPSVGLWIAALVFHYSLLAVVLRHARFLIDPVPSLIVMLCDLDGLFQVGMPRLYWTGVLAVAALLYLLGRRLWDGKISYISLPSDYFFLFLLLGIFSTGLYMRYFVKLDVIAVKNFAMSLISLSPIVPEEKAPAMFAHLGYASALLACFPFSKLMHMGGIFMSPTRATPNNSRQVRHINPWREEAAFRTYAEYEDEFRPMMEEAEIPLEKNTDSGGEK